MTRYAIAVVLLAAAQVAAAQTSPRSTLIEAGGMWSPDRSIPDVTDITVGRMWNTQTRSATGWTASLSVGGGSLIGGRVEARHRRRVGDRAGIDLSVGPVRRFVGIGADARPAYGLTAAVGTSDHLLGLNGRVDLLRTGRTMLVPSVGAQLRGKAVPVVAGSAAALWLLIGFMYSGAST